MREIAAIFEQFGFQVYESPEIEDDLTKLPDAEHPAGPSGARLVGHALRRRRGDAFCARTPPLGRSAHAQREAADPRAASPGAASDTRRSTPAHGSEFFQVEGLMVDEGTTMADLKGLLDQFAKAMYGARQADAISDRATTRSRSHRSRSTSNVSCGGGVGCPCLRSQRAG
jgi:phenylalanyl-tRNA synthetase alpha chain